MADLTITAANVLAQEGSQIATGTVAAGQTLSRGDVLCKEANTGKLMAANADSSGTATAVGIALNDAAAGQPISYLTNGPLSLGAILTVGERYFLSDAADGGICPSADVTTGSYVCYLGTARTISVLNVKLDPSGVAVG